MSFAQQPFLHLSLKVASLSSLATEQHVLTQLPLTEVWLADSALSEELFRRRSRFSAAFSVVTEPVLRQDSDEVRRREREDSFLVGRSRISQQDS
jgi:hypothetical protein